MGQCKIQQSTRITKEAKNLAHYAHLFLEHLDSVASGYYDLEDAVNHLVPCYDMLCEAACNIQFDYSLPEGNPTGILEPKYLATLEFVDMEKDFDEDD